MAGRKRSAKPTLTTGGGTTFRLRAGWQRKGVGCATVLTVVSLRMPFSRSGSLTLVGVPLFVLVCLSDVLPENGRTLAAVTRTIGWIYAALAVIFLYYSM